MTTLRPLGSTGLDCHPLGFGCYRIMDGNAGHEAALRAYLARGGNLIDTSANYGDGASEVLVGKVLRGIPPGRAIVVTKGGYIQGQNMALAQERSFPEVVEYGPGIWHSIHPEFLETQVERSLERMKRDSVDVYLLHNPEYYLEDAAHRRPLTADDHDEFYRRIREAFRYLERQVEAGRIGFYGVSSNNFGQPAFEGRDRPTTMTSVARCLVEAQAVSDDHHFRVVQLPLNLYEAGGAIEPNNEGQTVLAFCRDRGLAVLANRPLNAFHQNQMIRLADWAEPGTLPPDLDALGAVLEPLSRHEARWPELSDEGVRLASGETPSELLLRIVPQVDSPMNWEQVAGRHVVEPIQAWLVDAREKSKEHQERRDWLRGFVEQLNALLASMERHISAKQQGASDEIRGRLAETGYAADDQSLSQIALGVLGGLDGLSCTLVGMRRPEYVEDAMGAAIVAGQDGVGEQNGLAVLRAFSSRNT